MAQARSAALTAAGLADVTAGGNGDVAALLGDALPEEVVAALVGAGVRVRGFEVTTTSLEERFVALTGEGFDVAG